MGNQQTHKSGKIPQNTPNTNHNTALEDCCCLLLGTGFSGKSTLYFQLSKLDENQKQAYKEVVQAMTPTIYYNTVHLTIDVCNDIKENVGGFKNKGTEEAFKKVTSMSDLSKDPKSFYDEIKRQNTDNIDVVKGLIEIWKDKQMLDRLPEQKVSQFYFDGAEHFILPETLERLLKVDYVPTEDDILRSRRKTTGVFYNTIKNGSLNYVITDVGGQRSERKKWVKV